MTPADRRGRRAADPEPPPSGRPAGRPERRRPPARPGDGRRRAGQPARRRTATRTPGASSPTGCATRSASRSGPARTRSGSATSAGHVGGDQPGRRPDGSDRRELRLAVLRGAQRPAGLPGAPNLNLCTTLYARRDGHDAVLHLQPRREGRRGRDLPARAARRSRAWPSTPGGDVPGRVTTAPCSSPTTRGTASGRCSPARTACPTRRKIADLRRRARPTRSTSRSARAATSSTSTSTAAPIHRIIVSRPTNQPAGRRHPAATRPRVHPPLTVAFDGSGSSDPDPGDTLTYSLGPQRRRHVRRLDARDRLVHLHDGRPLHGRPAGHRQPRRDGQHDDDDHRRQRRRRPPWSSTRPSSASPGRSATRSPSPATPPTSRVTPSPPSGLSLVARHAPLPVELPHPRHPDDRRRRLRHVPRARPRLPVLPRAHPDGHRLGGPDGDRAASASSPRRST